MAVTKHTYRARQVPGGWQHVRLGDHLALCRNGLVSRQDASPDEAVPVTRIETIAYGKIDLTRVGYVPLEEVEQGYLVQKGDILLSHINSVKHIGKVARMSEDGPLLHGMNLMLLRFSDSLDPEFGYALMSSASTKLFMERRAKKAVNQASINRQDIFELPILLPPLPEQRAIAAVLDSIDDAIEGAEAVIAATEGLRDALLHDLLTHGLPGQHTEFREVLGLGTIPADWDVVRLGNKLEDGPTNGIYKPDSDYGSGVCLIRIDDFGFGEFESFGNFQRIRATEDEIRRYEVREGDIVVNRVNSLSHIGKSVLIPKVNEPTLFESNMMRIRFDRTLDSRFGAMVLLSDDTRRYFKARAKKAVQQASINQQDVNELPIPLPPLAEQRTIAGALYGVDAAIEVAGEERDGLRLLKGSTADALLTGRARLQI